MIELFNEERSYVLPLCKGNEEDATMFSCVEGKMGRLWVNDKDNIKVAIGTVGDFCFILGKCTTDYNLLIPFISKQCRNKIIICDIDEWEPLIKQLEQQYTGSFKRFSRYAIKGDMKWFDQEKLRENIEAISSEFQLQRIDANLFYKALEQSWSADFCSNFVSLEDFIEHGIGYVILHQGEMVAGASTFAYCEGKIEIEIVTKESYRRRGLALICASKLILECLERGLYPRWDAANLNSVALAEKLGYVFDKEYEVFSV